MAQTTFDSTLAVQYGQLVDIAYDMFASDPSNLTPPSPALPPGFTFIAWVQMKDFILDSTTWRFYGLIAQRVEDPTKFVLALRGTTNLAEWWDDLSSVTLTPLQGFGNVAYGFDRIFQTLRVVEPGDVPPTDIFGDAAKATKDFTHQVADTVNKHAPEIQPETLPEVPPGPAPSTKAIEVTGHSLGSALATLYVAKNANAGLLHVSQIYTFASPLVGDAEFATAFDKLPVTSWRIANILDAVTHVPAIGFEHVNTVQQYNSWATINLNLTCLHSMTSYLHLVHPAFPLDQECDGSISPPGPQIAGHIS